MSETLQGVLIGGLLGGGFTIVSVIVTATMNDRVALKKQKAERHLEKLLSLYENLENFFHDLWSQSDNEKVEVMREGAETGTVDEPDHPLENTYKALCAELFRYGTKYTVRLAAELNRLLILTNDKLTVKITKDSTIPIYSLSCISCLVLLICQVKYDYTGEKTNPTYWYKIKLPGVYALNRKLLAKENNKIAFRLWLPWFWYIWYIM